MNKIVINVSELSTLVKDIRRSGADSVCVCIHEADEDFPSSISFSARKSSEPGIWIDFEDIDALPDCEKLLDESFTSIHMSSNLQQ